MALSSEQNVRYARQILLPEVGGAGQARLLAAKVLVIGAGGLGSPLLLYLAAAGVGTITVVDDDAVALSNLQRQILYATTDVGAPKAVCAAVRLASLNPDPQVTPLVARVTAENAAGLVAAHDVVADCCDNFGSRFLINDACAAVDKPLVFAAVQGFAGQVAVFDPARGGPCLRCFNPAPRGAGPRGGEEIGILGAMAGMAGAAQALAVVKTILDLGDDRTGSVQILDGLAGTTRRVRLTRDPACPVCGNG